jgi:hypothetical protein
MNDDPATDGLYVGDFKGQPSFVGRALANGALGTARIQITDPKGAYEVYGGSEMYHTDPKLMWYLRKNPNHSYTWVKSSNASIVPFAIDTRDQEVWDGLLMYEGRIFVDGSVIIGHVVPLTGVFYYADFQKNMHTPRDGYEVLTCKSRVCEFLGY